MFSFLVQKKERREYKLSEEKHLFLNVYEDYLLYARKKLKNQSFCATKYKFDSHILPFFKDMYLEDITSKTILEWEEYILTFNFANNHNKGIYYALSGFLEYCRIFYGFDKTIVSKIGCFKKKYEEDNHDFYNLHEFEKFISCFDEEIYKQFFNLLFFTGLRPGEAMALKFKDLSNGYINISKTMESHGNRSITPPKTNSSIRKIKIDKKLQKDLENLKNIYKSKYDFTEDFFIFGGIKPLSPSTINRRKKLACEKANIRPITLHQFRHSHATLLIQNNMNINEVSRRLGHSKTSTTLDIYSHSDLAQEKRVFNTLNSLRFNHFRATKYKFKSILKRFLSF